MLPEFVDVFLSVIRDNQIAQVATVGVLIFILLDWLFGFANALMHKEFSSEKMREGLSHKSAEIGLLTVALLADGLLLGGLDLGISGPIYIFAAGYIILMELGSLLEIFAKMNPDLVHNPIFQLLDSVKESDHIPAHAMGDVE